MQHKIVIFLIFSLVLFIFVLGDVDQKIIFKQKCNKSGGQLLDPIDKNGKKICIMSENIKFAPKDQTEITITFNNVNINEIDVKSNQLTISMEINITWAEERLLLDKNWIFLKYKYHNIIWSPEFSLKTFDVLSKTKRILFNESSTKSISALKSFNLETTRKCRMDFEYFPFDKQECSFNILFFEVGIFRYIYIITKVLNFYSSLKYFL